MCYTTIYNERLVESMPSHSRSCDDVTLHISLNAHLCGENMLHHNAERLLLFSKYGKCVDVDGKTDLTKSKGILEEEPDGGYTRLKPQVDI